MNEEWYLSGPLKIETESVAVTWGNHSRLTTDQGGSIELGGNHDTGGIGTPYIDFHYQGTPAGDFNTRIINDDDGRLSLDAPTVRVTGDLHVQGWMNMTGVRTFITGFDGAANHWFRTSGDDEPRSVFMAFCGNGNGEALAVRIAPGAKYGLFVRNDGKVGVGTDDPVQQLSITGGIGFQNHNAKDKWLYSPEDGALEWRTHDLAAKHGFAVSHQGDRRVFLNTSGDSYFVGGNLGIGTQNPSKRMHVVGDALISGNLSCSSDLLVEGGIDFGNRFVKVMEAGGTLVVTGSGRNDNDAGQTLDSLPPYSFIITVESALQGQNLVLYWKDGDGNRRKGWINGATF